MYQEGCQEDEEAEDGKYEGLGLVEELCVASKDEKGFGQEEWGQELQVQDGEHCGGSQVEVGGWEGEVGGQEEVAEDVQLQ